ncbi:MAG: hypothetical protein IPM29_06890 [Planctomycetes bacterium]|nr:hypothetical protein [Planctomycetota bacterium]
MSNLLELLALRPSAASVDYVTDKSQFHLHRLLTEQRHPKTWDLSFRSAADPAAGIRSILAVDDDLERRLGELADAPGVVEALADAVAEAIRAGRRIYFYGCGATGRLAKQMESSFWRPFWRRVRQSRQWEPLRGVVPDDIEARLIGEMTGGDRALVSSLEGFEDLQLVGRLQLEDHGIARGDVVVCVTEGGETSSVIGTVLAARAQYGPGESDAARRRLFFVYNNPDDVLRPYDRSRAALDEPGITRINLATGPQAITGSTRMQATTIETFVLGVALEHAVQRVCAERLGDRELRALGFRPERSIADALREFATVRAAVAAAVPQLAELTVAETDTYRRGAFSTYLAQSAMVTVFTDCTERSPTFRLYPLDRVDQPARRCMVQVWTVADDAESAWRAFLGRPFRGLDPAFYRQPLAERVTDPYLHRAALDSLAQAGADQERLYDFSFSAANVARCGPRAGDLGVMVLVDGECGDPVAHRFAALCSERGARVAAVCAGELPAAGVPPTDLVVRLPVPAAGDPLRVRCHVAIKVLLNAHSTSTLARLGRVVGNTMTNVSPSNLKLFGRATFLVQSHVDDVLRQPTWIAEHGATAPITFAEANAVLFDALDWVRGQGSGQTAEVALSIVRILESLRLRRAVSWSEARAIVEADGLAGYLLRLNPALDSGRR